MRSSEGPRAAWPGRAAPLSDAPLLFFSPHSLSLPLPLPCPQNFAEERGIQFLETSAKNSNNVEKAFLMMAAEIKNRMAMAPQQQDDKDKVSVGAGEKLGAKAAGGCC